VLVCGVVAGNRVDTRRSPVRGTQLARAPWSGPWHAKRVAQEAARMPLRGRAFRI